MNNQYIRNIELRDDELVDGYLNGDISSFNRILGRYQAKLFSYIYHYIGNRQEAEDIFQETFYRVIANLKFYKQKGYFKAWLFKIAFNICIDHIRKKRKVKILSMSQQFSNDEAEEVALENMVASDAPSPAEIANGKEAQKLLREMLGVLPNAQKEVLLLRIYAGLSFKEISQVLGCSINTVLGRMQYALGHLRNILKEKGVIDEL